MFFRLALEASPTSSHNTPPTPCKVLPYQRVDAVLHLGVDPSERFVNALMSVLVQHGRVPRCIRAD
jgi:hypothetical protein